MNILVAGGAGYIGSITALLSVEQGHKVVVYDNLDRGHRQAVPDGAIFVQGDLGDRSLLADTFRENSIDSVMHFAAHSQVGESMTTPEIYFKNNVTVGQKILDTMRACDVRFMIFSSTCAIFGEPDVFPMHEDLPKSPTNVYGETKLMFEKMMNWYHKIYGLNFVSLRYFNACGAYKSLGEDHRPESHLIPVVLQTAVGQREKIAVYGDDYPTPDGSCIRDYIHVYDLAMAHILALEKKREGGHYYNLGNGDGYSVKEVIQAAREVTGAKIPSEIAQRRPGDPPKLVGSSEKIRKELGWEPQFASISSIIESAWKWHSDHPQGYLE